MPPDRGDGGGPPRPVLDVIADPEQGRHRLPYLLGVLDDGDATDRLTAATALCLVVDAFPDMLPYVVERLVERLDDDAPIAVGHALDYIAARDPKAVDETVTDLDDDRELRARGHLYQSGAGFARSEYLQSTPGDHPVGRTRIAGEGGVDDPRRVHTTEASEESDPLADDGSDDDADTDGTDDESEDRDADDADAEREGGGENGELTEAGVTRGTLSLVADRLSEVIERSRFEALDVLSERRRGRYGDVYRAAGRLDGEDLGLALTVFRLPEHDRKSFVGSLRAALTRWAGVDDHDRVLTVHDWGIRPRPWAALAYTDETLDDHAPAARGAGSVGGGAVGGTGDAVEGAGAGGDTGDAVEGAGAVGGTGAGESGVGESGGDTARPSLDAAVATVLDLADALAYAHQHGVVHGALDPETVVFPGTVLTEHERQRPYVAHPGVTLAYAGHVDVADYLDPRYAAPEHYDDRFGGVDAATDVYGLGLLCHRLVTGADPYDGPLSAVREAVVSGRSPRPSAVDPDLPAALDRVVGKATAARKLKRYETINVFRRELRSVDHGG